MKRGPRWYLAITPYTYTEPILEDGSGPTYDESSVLFVYARTKRRARYLALRAWTRQAKRRPREAPDFLKDDGNPFAAIKVERIELEVAA